MLTISHFSVFQGEKQLVRDVSLSINPGQLLLVLGQNGSGKSSFFHGVFGYPGLTSTGEIVFDDENVTSLKTEEKTKRGMYLVQQHVPEISGVTLVRLLARAKSILSGTEHTVLATTKKLQELCETYSISPTLVTRELGKGLSGGERKQIEALQLAFLEPKLVFLDEIDSGVDVHALASIEHIIEALRSKGSAILYASHSKAMAERLNPDAVIVFKDGGVARTGGYELAEAIHADGFNL